MEHCFIKERESTIFYGNWSEGDSVILRSSFSSITPKPLIKLNSNDVFIGHKAPRRDYVLNKAQFSAQNEPITSAVISISTNEGLATALEGLKHSIWWNYEALFLLVNERWHDSCFEAYDFLKTMWSFHVLSAIYFCRDSFQQLFIYTFNPYTDAAPKFWSTRETGFGLLENWTLFQHSLDAEAGSPFIFSKYYIE